MEKLLRVKDSNDALRRRPSKRSNANGQSRISRTAPTAGREAKNFTVGNVGHNGRLYLRYVLCCVAFVFTLHARVFVSLLQREVRLALVTVLRTVCGSLVCVWVLTRRAFTNRPIKNPSRPPVYGAHHDTCPSRNESSYPECETPNSLSSSQLSESRDLNPESREDGESNTSTSTSTRSGRPHKRLHKTRSASTILAHRRSSSDPGHHEGDRNVENWRTSVHETLSSNPDAPDPHHELDPAGEDDVTQDDPNLLNPPHIHDPLMSLSLPSSLSLKVHGSASPSFAESTSSAVANAGPCRGSESPFYELKNPVEPSIFDSLLCGLDDPSVVRYIPGTKNISAATPARIVAEISSESFMDYELVSDFFLTFRPYLSLSDLLSLLLARLRWAISRMQDDGRIIRIRTFAALRHWILNYFADDFYPNYDLRVQFCDAINAMYGDIKSRGNCCASDVKILLDLKRCWLGRSSTCWDIPDLSSAYNDPDSPILPGDTMEVTQQAGAGAADGTYRDMIFRPDFSANLVWATPFACGDEEGERLAHSRNGSATTARSNTPVSMHSDHSVQATSCSLPPKSPRRGSGNNGSSRAPHPVPLTPLKFSPTSNNHPPPSPVSMRRHFPSNGHSHKRSGSFADSVLDDRLSHGPNCMLPTMVAPTLGSLIRGDLYPPPEPDVTFLAMPPSPTGPSHVHTDTALAEPRREEDEENSKPAATSGVKTILGSIRRALQGKNGGQNLDKRYANSSCLPLSRDKRSALPVNVAFGSRLYPDRKAMVKQKKKLRVDILCDQVFRNYRIAVSNRQDESQSLPQGSADVDTRIQSAPAEQEPSTTKPDSLLQPPRLHSPRAFSQLTGGSESIVIVDGTGRNTPLSSGLGIGSEAGFGPRNEANSSKVASWGARSQASTLPGDGRASLPIYYDTVGSRLSVPTLPQRHYSESQKSYSAGRASGRGSAFRKSVSPSLRLRKFASHQSQVSRQRRTLCGEIPPTAIETDTEQDDSAKPSGRLLRRRPGGDLRRMRDGGSFASEFSGSSFTTEVSMDTRNEGSSMSEAAITLDRPQFSLIETHSSQDVRPSFEEAIAQFAQIPDEDDGGIESTLLKLEGKRRRQPDNGEATGKDNTWHGVDESSSYVENGRPSDHRQLDQSALASFDDSSIRRETDADESRANWEGLGLGRRPAPPPACTVSVAESENSNKTMPLLERGLTDESMKSPDFSQRAFDSLKPSRRRQLSGSTDRETSELTESHTSFDLVKKTDSLNRIPDGSTRPVFSFEGPENVEQACPGRPSEHSIDIIDHQDLATDERRSPANTSFSQLDYELPPHPLAQPPSPPITVPNSASINSCPPLNPIVFQAPPLTPGPSPPRSRSERENNNERAHDNPHMSSDVLMNSEGDHDRQHFQSRSDIDHVPFVLSCEPHILAQQLTLVEMAALSEIDWRDLVDIKCSAGPANALDWVQYLCAGERSGIDLVVGRFNLMVKWVLSEIVLTEEIHERARTISNFIYTAAHARSICNYATTLQICIALSSSDCSRLQRTWMLVPMEDRRLLRDMEALTQPVRNFHDLRMEMETANLQDGCVPFVGKFIQF